MNDVLKGTLAGVIRDALVPSGYGIARWVPGDGVRAMRWPSGICDIENRMALEGFYGFSVITGKYKLGKSIAAFASAALAAEQGIHVVYVDAELDAMQLGQRITRFGGASWWEQHRGHFAMRMLVEPMPLQTIADDVAAQLPPDAERALIVLDSLSRIAEKLSLWSRVRRGDKYARPIDYWTALDLVIDWCSRIRRLEPARIGVLVTSEENSHGTSKGQKIEYAGDMALRIKGRPDSDIVELSVPFSREGGEGELGAYRREWRSTRFVPQLRVVKDEQLL